MLTYFTEIPEKPKIDTLPQPGKGIFSSNLAAILVGNLHLFSFLL